MEVPIWQPSDDVGKLESETNGALHVTDLTVPTDKSNLATKDTQPSRLLNCNFDFYVISDICILGFIEKSDIIIRRS